MDEGVDGALTDEVAGGAVASTGVSAEVLDRDRQGVASREMRAHRWRVAGGRNTVVPSRWRDATIFLETGVGPVIVVRRARGDRVAAGARRRHETDRP